MKNAAFFALVRRSFSVGGLFLLPFALKSQTLIGAGGGGFSTTASGSASFSFGENFVAQKSAASGIVTEGQQQPDPIFEKNDTSNALKIPEGFTPNGDGKNDAWLIDGLENFPSNELLIINRWGETVFSAKPYLNDWDGRATGQNDRLPAGTYYFWLWPTAGAKAQKGAIYLIY